MPFFVQGANPDRIEQVEVLKAMWLEATWKHFSEREEPDPTEEKSTTPGVGERVPFLASCWRHWGSAYEVVWTHAVNEIKCCNWHGRFHPRNSISQSSLPSLRSPPASHSFFSSLLVVLLLPTLQKLRVLFSSCSKHIPSTWPCLFHCFKFLLEKTP